MKFVILRATVLALLIMGIPAAIAYVEMHRRSAPSEPRAISTVLISDDAGHGSGVHIGHGYILTAAHVVGVNSTMKITDSLGEKQTGVVLWSNRTYDVAMIRVDKSDTIAFARLDCRPVLNIGDRISAVGNPLNLEFVHTWGQIAASSAEHDPWKTAFVADIVAAPGMSGGGVFDRSGNVIGLVVGIAGRFTPFSSSPFAISYVVPSSAACLLMGRIV